ncbi:unnamed protein product [Diabrotica balteata]|uniref:Peptidase C1A papain C-terminal domain-containing protein n=1 Tax=Diabrotica balteata TaxID=107213 RepID=A0A9N9SVD5_DIABA|nr:unnamed protein product [Diabrotica balteata]
MSDRRCIVSEGKLKVPVSAENLMSCCYACGYGCEGGYPDMAWIFWEREGIPTGGLYGSNQGCQPYSLQPCEHHSNGTKVQCSTLDYETPSCRDTCDDSTVDFLSELTYASGSVRSFYSVADTQREVLTYGPVEAAFDVYSDFVSYKSGVYQHVAGEYLGGHAVRILGWGEENGVPYWLVANSWNEDWGDKGLFKILRGKNEVGFEEDVVAGLPKV